MYEHYCHYYYYHYNYNHYLYYYHHYYHYLSGLISCRICRTRARGALLVILGGATCPNATRLMRPHVFSAAYFPVVGKYMITIDLDNHP